MIELKADSEKDILDIKCSFDDDEMEDSEKMAEFAVAASMLIKALASMTGLSFDEAVRNLLVCVLDLEDEGLLDDEEEENS